MGLCYQGQALWVASQALTAPTSLLLKTLPPGRKNGFWVGDKEGGVTLLFTADLVGCVLLYTN